MPTYRFKQVDVFTARPLFGNPVAVVLAADGLKPEEMQRIAAWANLSETTFVQEPTTPDADYRLRIFHPTGELPFAGHPTVGSAHAALEAGVISAGKRTFVQECGAGLLPMRVEAGPEPAASRSRRGEGSGRLIFVQAPRARFVHDFSTSLDAISAALGARVSDTPPPASVDNGPAWLFCRFDDPATIAGLTPDMTAVARLSRDFGVTGFVPFAFTPAHPEEAPGRAGVGESAVSKDHAVHIRAFAPAVGVPEDPVTGSANASLPTYLARHNLLERTGREYVASQGTELGRDGRVHVRVLDDDGFAEVGGQAVTVIEGEIRL